MYSTCTVKLEVLSTPGLLFMLQSVGNDVHARNNLLCSRYTNEIHAQARSGRAKRAPLLVIINYYQAFYIIMCYQSCIDNIPRMDDV